MAVHYLFYCMCPFMLKIIWTIPMILKVGVATLLMVTKINWRVAKKVCMKKQLADICGEKKWKNLET